MSRIHDILNKAERDGVTRRTRVAVPDIGHTPAPQPLSTRGVVPAPQAHPSHESHPLHPPHPSPLSHPPHQAHLETALDPLLIAALAPHSLAAEQYRSLRTRIVQAENGRPLRVVVVTSPGKGDGKSVNAANLALTMGQDLQSRVLLVDADLRRPRTHRLLGVAEGPGLADVLMGAADLDQAFVAIPGQNLTVLPAGPPPSRPAELLGSSAMRRTLDTLRARFDRIIVDTPPVDPLADVHILEPLVDGIVLVVRAGVTPRPAIERALGGFDRSRVLGVVLNAADPANGYGREPDGVVSG